MSKNLPRFLLLLLLLTLALSGCSEPVEHLYLHAPDWSRAILTGNTLINAPVPIALGEDTLYLLQVRGEDDIDHPHVVALDYQGQVQWERTLEVSLRSARMPAILWTGEELRLFWISSRSLYTARLSPEGEALGLPALISGDAVVGAFDAAYHPESGLAVWFSGDREDPGIYALPLDAPTGEAVLVDGDGYRPDLAYSEDGTLHAAWVFWPTGYSDTQMYYAAYPGGQAQADTGVHFLSPVVGPTSVLNGPTLGLDEQNAYVIWTIRIMTGMEAGVERSYYTAMPLGQPADVQPQAVFRVPSDYTLDYTSAQADLQVSQWVDLNGQYQSTSGLFDVATIPHPAGEMVAAFSVRADYEFHQQREQVALAYFVDGTPVGYQLLSFTPPSSIAPYITSDDAGYLYITWLERGPLPGFQAYFASTNPSVQQSLARLNSQDILLMAGETIFGVLSGIVLAPLAILIWLIVPLIIIGLTSVLRRRSRFFSWRSLSGLVLALAAYWVIKISSLSEMGPYVPFRSWIPVIPSSWGPVLIYLVPVLIGILALAFAYSLTRGRETQTPLYFLLIYASIDGVLTMALYGSLIYSAF